MTDTSCEKATPVLVPMLSDKWVLGWRHALVCAWFGLFFMYLSYMPLFHSDIWGHVHYGKWMLEHGTMVVPEDPFMPLASGMHSVNNAWLAQVLYAKLYEVGGPHFLSHTFALLGLATYLLYFRTFYLVSGRVIPALIGTILALTVGWTRHAIIRPENFGVLAAAFLFWMLVHAEPWRSRSKVLEGQDSREKSQCPRWFWIAIPILFLFWVNAHGSFAVGLIVLACHAAGRVIEVAWQTRSLMSVLRDPWVRTWTLLTELAVLASLVNPYGIDMLIETATFGRNPNLKDILEWYALRLMDVEGLQFMLSIVIMLGVVRHSRLNFRAVDVLLLFAFAALTAPTIRMIGWYAPVFAFVMMPHFTDIWYRVFPQSAAATEQEKAVETELAESENDGSPQQAQPMKFAGTLICALIVYLCFALTPISQLVLGGKVRRPDQIYSRMTPLGVTKYLQEHPLDELIFTPQWWGDWIALDGGPQMKVFMTTHVHLAPSQVWKDYMRIQGAQNGWERTLERYKVRTMIVDKERQIDMLRALRGNEQWKVVYEDSIGMIVNRVNTAS